MILRLDIYLRIATNSVCRTTSPLIKCVYILIRIHTMRTNIVIDDKLMKETLRLTGLKTKREAVELGLRTVVRLRKQEEIRRFRGKLNWQGDLDAMRSDT
jgi:Arc/MetJ family transcription regulator